ncbi:MAG: hypothetical protein J0L69_10080 [Bacteroidetes bacterium]|nr:hypothetical protein [Bacteroidota bacterium]
MNIQIIKKTFAFTCIFSLLTNVVYPTVLANEIINSNLILTSSSSSGVADAADGMVDLYTGDFKYSVPLMSVPGPNGENVDITLGYQGGIRMNQASSWIGLGWDYNPGEISRQVVGSPDDYNGQPVYNGKITQYIPTNVLNPEFIYGPFNYENINTFNSTYANYLNDFTHSYTYNALTKSCDLVAFENKIDNYDAIAMASNTTTSAYSSSGFPLRYFKKPTAPYQAPAYDHYSISGPGIGGKLRPYIFKDALLVNGKAMSYNSYYTTKGKTQFYFEGSSMKNVYQADAPNNRIKSSYFIKYLTNTEINNINSGSSVFLDYRLITGTNVRRPNTEFDATGIGAIQVTNPNGITYHYSLPVYTQSEVGKSFNLTTPAKDDITLKSNNLASTNIFCKPHKFANSWKLTAVTGPDYEDKNNNKLADEGDTGYWIAYNYSLWDNSFLTASNIYNYNDGFVKQTTSLRRADGFGGYIPSTHKKTFSTAQSISQVYYLDYIRTATHTAYFIKDVKLDGHSYDNVLKGNSPKPLLKLKRVVLLRNENKSLIENNTNWNLSSIDSRFNTSLFSSPFSASLIHIGKYNVNKALIDFRSIKSVDLSTDYSLCKKLYNNINNTYTSTNVNYFPNVNPANQTAFYVLNSSSNLLYSLVNKSSFSTTDLSNSGKLTLNDIMFYEDNSTKVFPTYQFNYYKSQSQDNPDYDGDKTDIWGYYKSDYTGLGDSHFTTPTSSNNADAWSLKEIVTPIGENIKIEYEGDDYVREGYLKDPHNGWYNIPNPTMEMPKIIWPLNTFDLSNGRFTLMYKDIDLFALDYSNYSSTNIKLNYLVVPIAKGCTTWASNPPPNYSWLLTYLQGNLLPGFYGLPHGDNELIYPNGFNHVNGSNLSPGTVEYPDLYTSCNPYGSYNPHGYWKFNAMGYLLMKFSRLFGGGIRVKNIIRKDPLTQESYMRNYTYEDGYCKVPPMPFMLAAQTEFTQYLLWDNVNMLLPDGGGGNVGYSKVTAKSVSKFNTSNGYTKYSFINNTVNNPLITTASYQFNNIINPTNCSAPSFCYNNTNNPSPTMRAQIYNITSWYSNKDLSMQGKVEKVENFDVNNNLISKSEYVYDNRAEIKETYPHELESYISLPMTIMCQHPNWNNNQPYYINCSDKEWYRYYMHNSHHCPRLIKVIKTLDQITTAISYGYNTDLGEIYKTVNESGTDLSKVNEIEREFVNNSSLGFKCLNENNRNQLLLPSKIKTAKESPLNNTGYLIGEKTITYKNTYNMRVYNSGTSLYENSVVTKNWYTVDEIYERLLNDNTLETMTSGTSRLTSKTTLFSLDCSVLEERGLNNRPSSVKYGYNNLFKLCSIRNANYTSFTYSGYEDTVTVAPGVVHFGGEISTGNQRSGSVYSQWISTPIGSIPVFSSLVNPHTGNYMAKVPANNFGPTYRATNFEIDRTYRAQVWVHKNSPSNSKLVLHLQGTTTGSAPINDYQEISKSSVNNIQVGDWLLMSLEISVPANIDLTQAHTLAAYVWNLGGDFAYYDDFKFHPIDSPIIGNVYDPKTGRVIAVLDEENFATKYSFDAAGRITATYKETKTNGVVKVSEHGYHNSRP